MTSRTLKRSSRVEGERAKAKECVMGAWALHAKKASVFARGRRLVHRTLTLDTSIEGERVKPEVRGNSVVRGEDGGERGGPDAFEVGVERVVPCELVFLIVVGRNRGNSTATE